MTLDYAVEAVQYEAFPSIPLLFSNRARPSLESRTRLAERC